jgi:protoheme IX farnesyltransferase
MMRSVGQRSLLYLPLIKARQTALLLITGFAGYVSSQPGVLSWEIIAGLLGSLALAISGSTVLNMVFDRDIDARMNRTARRPLPSGRIGDREALALGLALSSAGLIWAFSLSIVYGLVVFAGLFTDVIVYTLWLKRRTAWSIIWGGISGGMPILAGRVLGTGTVDYIGILLAVSILLWIPTHILTFSLTGRHSDDFRRAGIPTFPQVYGRRKTRIIIALSSTGAACSIALGCFALGLEGGYIRLLSVLTAGIIGLAVFSIYRPSDRVAFGLFKYASLYMLGAMLMLVLGTLK